MLSPRGVPTPLAATRLVPPDSLMAAIDEGAFAAAVAGGALRAKYGTAVDRQSAHEIISGRIAAAKAAPVPAGGAAPGSTGAARAPGELTATERRRLEKEIRDAELARKREQRLQEEAARRERRYQEQEARRQRKEMEGYARLGNSIARTVLSVLRRGR